MAEKSLAFCKDALKSDLFPRNDYKHLCQYVVAYLDSPDSVSQFRIHKPAACHEARFMADSLYILAMELTQPNTNFLSIKEHKIVSRAAMYIAAVHAMNFLQSNQLTLAASNDLNVMKSFLSLSDAFLKSFKHHLVVAHNQTLSYEAYKEYVN